MSGEIHMARWTPAWFAAGLGMLFLALALMATGHGAPFAAWEAGESRAILHLLAVGWIGTLMIGASLQFVPVLTAVPLALDWLSPLALGFWSGGALSLALGFWKAQPGPFTLAAVLLAMAAAMALAMLAPCVAHALARLPLSRLLALSLAGMAAAVALGVAFALARAGVVPLAPGPALRLLHGFLGLGLWFTLGAMAVSFQFLAMFGLAPQPSRRSLAAPGALAAIATLAALALPAVGPWPMLGAAVAAVGQYLGTGARMNRQRKLKKPDVSLRGGLWAAVTLGPAAMVLVAAALAGSQALAVAGGALLLLGWLSGLTLAFIPKIIGFLTWMEVFGPRMGLGPVPPTAALTDARRIALGLSLWAMGTAVLAASLALGLSVPAQGATILLLAGAGVIARETLAVRRLAHLPPDPLSIPPRILQITP
ncbi:hypothetical protein [Paracoccus chinensis]|uniref:Uncharacterized protein n=1 Tax=Paracoccus chinensis TaxID=525640 RepID=A0A1G9EPF7_9RHOB|nr:hypothetical protein [Paracoccus chinensis]SDK77953.1 hypothetical protein SAMN04487971_10369 [Paracoccus chinensis]